MSIRNRIRTLIKAEPELANNINELCAKIWVGEEVMYVEDLANATYVSTITRARAVVIKEMREKGELAYVQ